MTKTPIKHEDVRVGDLIRAEWADGETATESRVTKGGWYRDDKTLFLLDRPEPPYELPTEPGLYTIADSTDGIHRKRLFKLSSWRAWMEDEDTWSNREGMKVRDFLMKKKWHLKRLVIEE